MEIVMILARSWLPFAFCAFLVYQYVAGPRSSDNWYAFAIWLPMCFFFVCAVMYQMQKQIQHLEAELQELKNSKH
jgi:intracellular septation protein A